MRTRNAFFAGSFVLVMLCSHALAVVDATVVEARALIERGQPQQAFDLLAPFEAPRAGDPDFDTVLGIAANETGQFTRAVFALERALSVQPENARARAELGRALFAVGDNRASRRVLLKPGGKMCPEAQQTPLISFFWPLTAAKKLRDRPSVPTWESGLATTPTSTADQEMPT